MTWRDWLNLLASWLVFGAACAGIYWFAIHAPWWYV